jgi:hypothetical protein
MRNIIVLIVSLLAIFSISAQASLPGRVAFDLTGKDLAGNKIPMNSEVVMAFTYDATDTNNPGVVRYKDDSHSSFTRWPFNIKTDSKTISITRAEVQYKSGVFKKYQIEPSCHNIEIPDLKIDDRDSIFFVYINLDIINNILSCGWVD